MYGLSLMKYLSSQRKSPFMEGRKTARLIVIKIKRIIKFNLFVCFNFMSIIVSFTLMNLVGIYKQCYKSLKPEEFQRF